MTTPTSATDDNTFQRPVDSLYRVAVKCLLINDKHEVLVVKEKDRESWDLPGGGIEHGETIKSAIAREMKEEVSLEDDFDYQLITMEDSFQLSSRNIWQIRVVYKIITQQADFYPGIDADKVAWIDAAVFEQSIHETEQKIWALINNKASSSSEESLK